MQEGATEAQIQQVIDRMVAMGFTVHRSTGVIHTVLGGVGPEEGRRPDRVRGAGRRQGSAPHRLSYKLAGRHFRPAGTVVKVGDVEIGGNAVVVMAGPCSVENRDQIERSAEAVARAGDQDHPRRRLQAAHARPTASRASARRACRCCARPRTATGF